MEFFHTQPDWFNAHNLGCRGRCPCPLAKGRQEHLGLTELGSPPTAVREMGPQGDVVGGRWGASCGVWAVVRGVGNGTGGKRDVAVDELSQEAGAVSDWVSSQILPRGRED